MFPASIVIDVFYLRFRLKEVGPAIHREINTIVAIQSNIAIWVWIQDTNIAVYVIIKYGIYVSILYTELWLNIYPLSTLQFGVPAVKLL